MSEFGFTGIINLDFLYLRYPNQENRALRAAAQREPELGDAGQPAGRHRHPRRGDALQVQRGLPRRLRDRQGHRPPPAQGAVSAPRQGLHGRADHDAAKSAGAQFNRHLGFWVK